MEDEQVNIGRSMCPVCGDSNFGKSGYQYNRDVVKQIYECKQCGTRFVCATDEELGIEPYKKYTKDELLGFLMEFKGKHDIITSTKFDKIGGGQPCSHTY